MDDNSIQQPVIPPSLPKSSFKLPVTILLVAILGVVGYAGASYYLNLWPFEISAPIPTFTPRSSPATSPTNQVDGLKTYRNDKYGFEFDYPINACDGNEFCKTLDVCDYDKTCPDRFILEVGANDDGPHWAVITLFINKKSVKNYFNELKQDPELQITKESQENVNNINWSIIEFKETVSGRESTVAGTEHSGYSFYLTELPFLSNFRFIQSIDISTWKNYTNQGYNYSLKYPTDWSLKESAQIVWIQNSSLKALIHVNVFPNYDGGYDGVKIRENVKALEDYLCDSNEEGPCSEIEVAVKKSEGWILKSVSDTLIDGKNAVLYKYSRNNNQESSFLYYVPNKGGMYEIESKNTANLTNPSLNTFLGQIVSTFKINP